MSINNIPPLSDPEIDLGFAYAFESPRRRYAKILHRAGADFNQVFNFMLHDSYMQPHLHPSDEKSEDIYLVKGKLSLYFFDDFGNVEETFLLEAGKRIHVCVPSFTWHTYVMRSEKVVTFETMSGRYDPNTWKKAAPWAPDEQSNGCLEYLSSLRAHS